ncbi:NfeD family protein [Aeromicrobium sp.]|uniref:NfeD family protein n=1 Tax=Aeromicrobium sp. TaxID=1871063 RepID=UPI0025BE8995|nr:NfeD family protein [Aeromicrobium sp.]
MSDHMWVTWVGLGVVLAVTEMVSLDLVLLMFALGALAAAVASVLGAPLWVSVLVLGVVSVGLLYFVRPPMVARLHSGPTLTSGHNVLIGRVGVVVEPVAEFGGRIQLAGELWSARTMSKTEHFEPGTEVLVSAIDGATAVVTTKES